MEFCPISRPNKTRSVIFRPVLAAGLPVWSITPGCLAHLDALRFTADNGLSSFFPQTSGLDVLGNLLLFVPFALILGVRWQDWRSRKREWAGAV